MPRETKLNWDKERNCWVSKYRKQRKRFPGGKGKSDREAYKKARQEWKLWKAEIDLITDQSTLEDIPGYLECFRGWEAALEHGRSVGDQLLIEKAESVIAELRKSADSDDPRELSSLDFHPASLPRDYHEDNTFFDYQFFGAGSTEEAQAMDFIARRQLAAARHRLDSGTATSEVQLLRLSLATNIDNFLTQKRRQVEIGELSATRAEMLGRHFDVVVEHFPPDLDVTTIDSQSLVDFRHHCMVQAKNGRFAESTARDAFAAFKQLVKWMYSTAETIDRLPRNFNDKQLAIYVSSSEPNTLTVDQIEELIADCTARTELYILLGLNCGYRQTDIASIQPKEVDWSAGKIKRKRTKTAKHKQTPMVTYQLWPRTFELLKNEGKRDGDRVLLSCNGTPLVSTELRADGKAKKNDAIKSAMQRLTRKKDFTATMDLLRNTAATRLRGNAQYATLVDLFLGHAPRSVADKSYAAAPIELLAEATDWLGTEFQITSR